jgi:hypothetical protein
VADAGQSPLPVARSRPDAAGTAGASPRSPQFRSAGVSRSCLGPCVFSPHDRERVRGLSDVVMRQKHSAEHGNRASDFRAAGDHKACMVGSETDDGPLWDWRAGLGIFQRREHYTVAQRDRSRRASRCCPCLSSPRNQADNSPGRECPYRSPLADRKPLGQLPVPSVTRSAQQLGDDDRQALGRRPEYAEVLALGRRQPRDHGSAEWIARRRSRCHGGRRWRSRLVCGGPAADQRYKAGSDRGQRAMWRRADHLRRVTCSSGQRSRLAPHVTFDVALEPARFGSVVANCALAVHAV